MRCTKLSFFILVLLIGSSISTEAQWFPQNNPAQNNSLRDIFVFDNNNAIIVGGDAIGIILKTIDGGENWLSLSNDTTDWLNSVYFVNDTVGWIVGSSFDRSIQKTTDGGNNWIGQLSAFLTTLRSVQIIDEDNGWAVGDFEDEGYGIIYKTTDGGINWIFQSLAFSGGGLSSVFFINNDTGWVVGNGGFMGGDAIIAKTTDSGETWLDQSIGGATSHLDIYFVDENIGWAVGTGGNIFKTIDGGENWISQISGTSNDLYSIHFADENTGWAVGDYGIIIKTIDGGLNWIIQESGTNNLLHSVQFADDNTGWAVGANGTILKTINGGIPVELISFTASTQSGYVELRWSTATETNNMIFEIERREENSDFVLIGFVEGNGTTTERQEYSYVDRNVTTGKYSYRLKQIDFDGTFEYSNEVEVDAAPVSFSLGQNYPNPFNPSTTIKYSIPNSEFVTLKVYDVLGNEVATLVNEEKPAGEYEVEFNASGLTSGIYFYKLQAGSFIESKKMILMK